MSASAPFRLWRSVVFAAVCAGVSVGGHALASGHAVPIPGVAMGFLLILGMAWVAARREQGYGTILAWLLWGQLALHVVFRLTQAPPTAAHGTADTHAAHLVNHPAVPEVGGSSASMLLVHLLAVLVSAWWLRRGEAAAYRLTRAVGAAFVPPLLRPRPSMSGPAHAVSCAVPLEPAALGGTVLRYVRTLRGPPLRIRSS